MELRSRRCSAVKIVHLAPRYCDVTLEMSCGTGFSLVICGFGAAVGLLCVVMSIGVAKLDELVTHSTCFHHLSNDLYFFK